MKELFLTILAASLFAVHVTAVLIRQKKQNRIHLQKWLQPILCLMLQWKPTH
jgi:hypothetical protein